MTVRIPLLEHAEGETAVLDIRGRVEVAGRARAVLVVQAGGETTRLDPASSAKDGDYYHQIPAVSTGGGNILATFFLVAEREVTGTEISAWLALDSVNLTLHATLSKKV